MNLRTRCALGAAVASIGILASGAAAQAQPTLCSTRMFTAVDHAVQANPRGFAELLAFSYRFAPRATLADFDTFAQCDPTTASSVFHQFQSVNPAEASSFETAFRADYPADAERVFGYGGGGGVS